MSRRSDDQVQGYTLIEMMITVAIIGILAAVAIPAYNGYVQTGKQAEAKAGLSTIALLEEQYFAENRTYIVGGDAAALTAAIDFHPEADTNFAWSVAAGADGIGTSFVAVADGSAKGLPKFRINEMNVKEKDAGGGWTAGWD
jgi:prepilin-type N-terminal cleavage/methylation domain-containing protein